MALVDKTVMLLGVSSHIVSGDAIHHAPNDLITQTILLREGFEPLGDGWRKTTWNDEGVSWARVCLRKEI